MAMLLLIALAMAGGSSAQLEEEGCDASQIDKCLATMPRTRVGLPRNAKELHLHCTAYNIGMACMDSWTGRCLNSEDREMFYMEIPNVQALFRYLCSNNTKIHQEYLNDPGCMDRMTPHWARCKKQLKVGIEEIRANMEVPTYTDVNQYAELCCVRFGFEECVAEATTVLCYDPAALLLRRIAYVVMEDVVVCPEPPAFYCTAPALPIAAPLFATALFLFYLMYF